jgi:hypothetical protein
VINNSQDDVIESGQCLRDLANGNSTADFTINSLETLADTQMLHYVDASLAFSMTRAVFLVHVMPRGALETP